MCDRSSSPILCMLVMALMLPSWRATGAEGALSLYLPGVVGDILVALPPTPGLNLMGSAYVQTGSAGTAVLQGAVNLGLDLDIALGIVGATYSFETPWFGGTYTVSNNWMDGGGFTVYCGGFGEGVQFHDNLFGRSHVYGPAYNDGPCDWHGNRYDDDFSVVTHPKTWQASYQ